MGNQIWTRFYRIMWYSVVTNSKHFSQDVAKQGWDVGWGRKKYCSLLLELNGKPLCSTALAGLFPASDSLDRCWWDSARHSTSVKRVLRAMAGWLGSWVMFRYAARLSCSSITRACSNSCRETETGAEVRFVSFVLQLWQIIESWDYIMDKYFILFQLKT